MTIVHLVRLLFVAAITMCSLVIQAQQQVLFDLEPEHLNEWQFYYGPVSHAFNFEQKHATTPGATAHVGLATPGDHELISGQALTSPITNSTAIVLGDGSNVNAWGAGAIWSFQVQAPDQAIVLHLFSVLQDPGHSGGQDPFVRYELRNSRGQVLGCGSYKVESARGGGWVPVPYTMNAKQEKQASKDKKPDERANVFYKPWTEFLIPLGDAVGERLTLEIMVGDCVRDGHWGMAAFDLTLVSMALEQSGSLSCDSPEGVHVSAPAGASNYQWSNGASGRQVEVQEGGPITVTMTTMSGCPMQLSTVVETMDVRSDLGSITQSGKLTCDSTEPVTLTAPENPHGYRWSTGETGQSIRVSSPDTYTVELPAAPGRTQCDQDATVVVEADLSIPEPTFTLEQAAICEGSTVGISAVPVPSSLKKRITEQWSMGNGEEREGAVESHVFAGPGTFFVTRRYVFGQCLAEHIEELIVHANPRPGLRPEVICSPEKHFRVAGIGIPMGSPVVDLSAMRCAGDNVNFERNSDAMLLPMEVDSCHAFTIHVVDVNGCIGDGELSFTPPPDPEIHLELKRVPPVTRILFDVLDSSLYVVDRVYVADEAMLFTDSLSGIVSGMEYAEAGTYVFELHATGVEYTCPDSMVKVLRIPESLWGRFGPKHPRPDRTKTTRVAKSGQVCTGKP